MQYYIRAKCTKNECVVGACKYVIKWKLDFPCLPVGQWHDNLQCTEKGKQDVRNSFIKQHLDSKMHLRTYYCEKGCNGVRDIPPLDGT